MESRKMVGNAVAVNYRRTCINLGPFTLKNRRRDSNRTELLGNKYVGTVVNSKFGGLRKTYQNLFLFGFTVEHLADCLLI